jgi:long-chain acyl-CoA synthetase
MTTPLNETLPGRLASLGLNSPDETALREKNLGVWQEISWSEYLANTAASGRMLRALGVEQGDHVAILSDNCPEWLYADLGAQGIGARSAGIYQTNPPEDVAYVLNHSQVKVLFCEDQEQVDKAIEVKDSTPTVTHVVVFDPRGLRNTHDDRLMSWEDFIKGGKELMRADPDWFLDALGRLNPDEPTMVVYTSGTTGQPKGALLTSRNALQTGDATQKLLGTSREDSILSYLPLCHVAEKIFSEFIPLISGAVVHFGESIETIRQDLAEVSPTIFLGVPRIWEKMHANVTLKMQDSSFTKRVLFKHFTQKGDAIARRRRQGSSKMLDRLQWWLGDKLVYRPLQERLGLRNCMLPVSGAAPISADLIHWFHGIGVPIYEGYGLTESAGVSHLNRPGSEQVGSVGQTVPGVDCVLAEDGEILIRGANIFYGYLHNAEATSEAKDGEGWLHTGDIGAIDEAGYLKITGRKKEIIITAGGKNLSPEKIENALKMSPYIKESVAVGDARKFISALIQIDLDATGDWATRQGITYTSFSDLVSKPEVTALIQSDVHRANERLAKVEHVRAFRLLPKELHQDDGEMTATQKIRRRAVVERYAELIEEIYGGSA